MNIRKMGLGLMVIVMLLTFATSASASTTRTDSGTTTHSGGNLSLQYYAYDSHVHGWMYATVYRVTASGDVFVGSGSIEGGMPHGNGIRTGNLYLGNQPAGTYKYVITLPSAWMGPSIVWGTY
ncbi:hypothetical protein [Paenibacillus paeoniae]|uniref:Uncharacterized protein n=1 Tax=Paenibacillus paeoniae TaxID=2292705 RepID=A0A371PGM9_9BACL|nr:hypothetical protein [Paenibacillus paeoniae]REK74560.1 hypothetical protein DX130_12720 [Paenibacillus paeoniae]